MSAENQNQASSLTALVQNDTPIVLDGALATYLESKGADISSALWSAELLISNPDLIYQAHLDYYRAGANVVTTASYQASFEGLQKHAGLTEKDAIALVKKSVELAFRARDDYLKELDEEQKKKREGRLFVAGSVGPYGAFLADGSEYRGDYTLPKNQMQNFHRGRIRALVEAGVDVLAIETIPSYPETEALIDLLEEEGYNVPVWFSWTLKSEDSLSDGSRLIDASNYVTSCGRVNVIAMGVNCISETLALKSLGYLSHTPSLPIVVYPNSGELWDAEKRFWHGKKTEGVELKQLVVNYWKNGGGLIGGCCRTTPDDIKVIAEALQAFEPVQKRS